ncbi:MAG: hypothetical protein Fur0046_21500 [Cyanobacteria bacterium J069]|nr:MAG: chemotaxis protein CheW [Cyanobacteria bacterium J069]
MALHPSLRALRAKPVAATRQLLVFPLRQERFALPLTVVCKVIEVDRLYAQQPGEETAIALDHDQNIPVLAVRSRIFPHAPEPPKRTQDGTAAGTANDHATETIKTQSGTPQYLVLVYDFQGEVLGLAIDGPPVLQRFTESAFKPLSALYQQEGGVRCVSGLILPTADSPPIFLLNLAQLLQPQVALLGSG